MLTDLLLACFWVSLTMLGANVVLLTLPFTPSELRLWRALHIGSLRRWVSRRRNVNQPLHPELTYGIAHKNIVWHLVLTGLFSAQIAAALLSARVWWRPLAPLLVLPCVAYFVGSVIQRQKMAVLRLRGRQARSKT